MKTIEILIEDLCNEIDFLKREIERKDSEIEKWRCEFFKNVNQQKKANSDFFSMMFDNILDTDSLVNKGILYEIEKEGIKL